MTQAVIYKIFSEATCVYFAVGSPNCRENYV